MYTWRILCVTAAALCLAAPAAAADLPQALRALEELADDEDAFVRAVRDFDNTQRSLAEWDVDMAREHQAAGEEDLMDEKLASARERFELVRQAYDYAVERYPRNARILNYYGELEYDVFGDEAKGVELWRTAANIDPDLPFPHNNLGIHYCHVGRYEDGLRHFDRTLELDPDNPDFLFNVVQIYLVHFHQVQEIKGWDREEIFERAMEKSRRATELEPEDYQILQDYAMNYFTAEDFGVDPEWDKAAEAWAAAREHADNEDAVYYTWLNEARAWLRHGDGDRARACLEEARVFHPDSGAVQQLLEQADEL